MKPLYVPAVARETRGDAHETANTLVMAWARHGITGELRYILEVEGNGVKCNCVCISCGKPLTAVNSNKQEYLRRPHFRHPEGTLKQSCLVLAARAAIAEALREAGTLVLPRRRRSAHVIGFSGTLHEAWVDQPAEPIKIVDVIFNDSLEGILTLDDGRQLEVRLVGSATADGPRQATACIEVVVDDPAIAAMPLDEVRKRLVPLMSEQCWRGHWSDESLDLQAAEAAADSARLHLDWGNDDGLPLDTPASVRRETILHRVVKEILAAERKVMLPGHTVTVHRDILGKKIERSQEIQPRSADLIDVVLERRMGRIVPDVIATEKNGDLLLIEVTVTNPIAGERLERIIAEGYPAIEIDIGSMGGRVTRAGLEKLIVQEVAGKRWLYYPDASAIKAQLESLLDKESKEAMRRPVEGQTNANRTSSANFRAGALQGTRHPNMEWSLTENGCVRRFHWAGEHMTRYKSIGTTTGEKLGDEYAESMWEATKCLQIHGYPEAGQSPWYEEGRKILERLLYIKNDALNRPSGWPRDVLDDMMQDASQQRQWHTLYLIAMKVYAPTLTPTQQRSYKAWRSDVLLGRQEYNSVYQRDTRYDNLVALLFPKMRRGLEQSRQLGASVPSVDGTST